MPKTKARKKKSVARHMEGTAVRPASAPARVLSANSVARTNNVQSLLMPGMVALGSWGIAFTFTFLTTQPNHLLFGGMAALMALLWSVSLGLRVQRMMQRR